MHWPHLRVARRAAEAENSVVTLQATHGLARYVASLSLALRFGRSDKALTNKEPLRPGSSKGQ